MAFRNHDKSFFWILLSRKPSPFRRFDFSGRNMFFEFNILKCNFVCQANVKVNRSYIQSRLNFDSSLRINLADELHFFTLPNTDVKFKNCIFFFFFSLCYCRTSTIIMFLKYTKCVLHYLLFFCRKLTS